MGITDSAGDMFDKAKGKLAGHGDDVQQGVDKAAEAADEKTGGKYSDKIDKGAEAVKGRLDDTG
ncbi:MAG TPA: antitoxin [Micromonosporaceae bacterium]|nr:antitoxin [Micromonosporaceae bacterium]